MGQPLSGKPSIPERSAVRSTSELHTEAAAERAACRKVTELRALLELDRREQLQEPERDRLVCLLEERASLASADPHGKQLWSADLERMARLSPARAGALEPSRALAASAAGDRWLGVGDRQKARHLYELADSLGGASIDFRLLAAAEEAPPSSMPIQVLEQAVRQLPGRTCLSFAQAYAQRGGANEEALLRALAVAEAERRPALAAVLRERLVALGKEPGPPSHADAPPPEDDRVRPTVSSKEFVCGRCDVDRNDLDVWPLAGALLSSRITRLTTEARGVLGPSPRSRRWAELLVEENPTSPQSLATAALIDGLAGRFGSVERKLTDVVFFASSRDVGLALAAQVWQEVGRPREACGALLKRARWRDTPEADLSLWGSVIACTRRDPGAGDWQAIRRYVLDRVPEERRDATSSKLDAAGELANTEPE